MEIDGCEVSRASLHNLTFIKGLELHPGCRILVSKRNMIIPHVEENLDRGNYQDMTPQVCPCCGQPTRAYSRAGDKGRIVETLHCDNLEYGSRVLQHFVHFAEKKAMNIRGLSEATLDQLIQLGALKNYQDLYHLDRYRDEIIAMEGFGEKSYENLIASIDESRNTTFVRFVVAMDIPLIGRTASRILEGHFHGNLRELELAALDRFDFTCLEGIGDIMSSNIQEWFHNSDHLLQTVINFPQEHICYLLNTMGMWVRNGETFHDGDMVSGIYEDCSIRLKQVRETDRDVLRLIIPDAHNRFPEDENCMEPYRHQELEMFTTKETHYLKKAVRKMAVFFKYPVVTGYLFYIRGSIRNL